LFDHALVKQAAGVAWSASTPIKSVHDPIAPKIYDRPKKFDLENSKCPPRRNTTVQLSTPYTDPERHNTQQHRQTDRQTDSITCHLG